MWKVFTVKEVRVEGNKLYSAEQVQELVLNDEYSWNSLYVVAKYNFKEPQPIPFLDTIEVSLEDAHTVLISVYEKGMLGVPFILMR